MKVKTPSFFALTSGDINQLENRLIEKSSLEVSIEEMQQLFIESKVLDSLFKQQQERKLITKQNSQAVQKRIAQIQQLQRVVKKQTSLMKSETSKISEALVLNKILTMEKLLRMQRETEEIQRKRQMCRRIKNENKMQNQVKKIRMSEKLQRVRLESLNNTVNIKNQLHQVRCNTMQMKRRQAEEVKLAHERQKSRSNKIETYKRLRARKNYLQKIEQMKEEINQRQTALQILCRAQNDQQIKVGSTIKVTDQYLHSFFPTQDISK